MKCFRMIDKFLYIYDLTPLIIGATMHHEKEMMFMNMMEVFDSK